MKKQNLIFIKASIVGLLIAVLGWSLFDLTRTFFEKIALRFGFSGPYSAHLMIIILILLILLILGISFRKAFVKALN